MFLLQGKNMSPQEALGLGVAQAVVPVDQVVQTAKDWVKANPKGGVQPWDQKSFKFPGGVGATNPNFVQTFIGGTAAFLASGVRRPGDYNTTLGTTLVFKGISRSICRHPDGLIYCHKLPGGLWLPGAAGKLSLPNPKCLP